jgi:hypothetical protein
MNNNDIIISLDCGIYEGFQVTLSACIEHEPLENAFPDIPFPDFKDLCRKIESNELMYFTAQVTVSRQGIVIGSDHLGGCVYKDLEDFRDNSGCYEDMREQAIKTAYDTIEQIQKPIKEIPVCFFREKEPDSILAVFVDSLFYRDSDRIYDCYSFIGQHSTCTREYLEMSCVLASKSEYKDLLEHLKSIYEAEGLRVLQQTETLEKASE